jgi:hypothetical protein
MGSNGMADLKYSVPKQKALDDSKKATKAVDVNRAGITEPTRSADGI